MTMVKLAPLVCLFVAILLGFAKKMNTGLVAIGLAFIVGRAGGMSDAQVIRGFNSSLFVMLLGVTYLCSIAHVNGTLELFARKIVGLTGNRVYLVPIVVFLLSSFLSVIGPGSIPVMALMMPFSMTLAAEMKISPLLLAPMGVLGACGAGVSPLAPTGIIGLTLSAQIGVTGIELPYLLSSYVVLTIWAVVLYFALGGHRLKAEGNVTGSPVSNGPSQGLLLETSDDGAAHQSSDQEPLPEFNSAQITTLAGIACMVLGVLVFKVNVGLASFLISFVLTFLGVADERQAIAGVPWGTLLLVTGVGVLMEMGIQLGSIDLLGSFLAGFMNKSTATLLSGLTGGIISWFSSTAGVVLPTLIPTVPNITSSVGGGVQPLSLISAITNSAHAAASSPLSTGGALALAAYVGQSKASPDEQQKLFIRMFLVSAVGVAFVSILGGLGLYDFVAGLVR
jgi:di/tricarboxylate transporter